MPASYISSPVKGTPESRKLSRLFNYALDYAHMDLRRHPELYRIGKGEQGVLMVQPYKAELLPLWRFATPCAARLSSTRLYRAFLKYVAARDVVGADMARKFLQMGFTGSRRYANHKGGRKYDESKNELPRLDVAQQDPAKAESARIFYAAYKRAEANGWYASAKAAHKLKYG